VGGSTLVAGVGQKSQFYHTQLVGIEGDGCPLPTPPRPLTPLDNNDVTGKFPNFPFPFFPIAFRFPIFRFPFFPFPFLPFPFFPFPFYPDP